MSQDETDAASAIVTLLTIDPAESRPQGIDDDGPRNGAVWTEFAQNVFRELLTFTGEENWAKVPAGPLAYHWNHPTGQSASRLIHMAMRLNQLGTTCNPR